MYRYIDIEKSEDSSEFVKISYGVSNANEIMNILKENYFAEITNNKEDNLIKAKYAGTKNIHDGKAKSALSNIDAKIHSDNKPPETFRKHFGK